MVVDVRGVKLRCGNGRKEPGENAGPAVCKLVEDKGGTGEFGEDGKKAGASRRLQHDVCRRDCGGNAGDERQPDGVENCWRDSLSSDRRVWVGRRFMIFMSIGSIAAGEVALARIAAPCRRRNMTLAASQASQAIFQFQAPVASEAPKSASIALRRTAASMRWPRSRSVKSCRAAVTIAEATTAVARIESGAALEPLRRDSVMGGCLSESGKGSNRPALS
jgi:hypothetical protein